MIISFSTNGTVLYVIGQMLSDISEGSWRYLLRWNSLGTAFDRRHVEKADPLFDYDIARIDTHQEHFPHFGMSLVSEQRVGREQDPYRIPRTSH